MFRKYIIKKYLTKNIKNFNDNLIQLYGKKEYYKPYEVLDTIEIVGIKNKYCLYLLSYFCQKSEYNSYIKNILLRDENGKNSTNLAIDYYDYYMTRNITKNSIIHALFSQPSESSSVSECEDLDDI